MDNSYGNSNSSINICPVCSVEGEVVGLKPNSGMYSRCSRCGLHFSVVEIAMNYGAVSEFLSTLISGLPGFVDLWSNVEPVVRKSIILTAAQGE